MKNIHRKVDLWFWIVMLLTSLTLMYFVFGGKLNV